MKILNKQKVEQASNKYEESCFYDLGITEAFEEGIEYAENELSELAIEFAKYAVRDYQNWLKGDISCGNVNEDLLKQFITGRNDR